MLSPSISFSQTVNYLLKEFDDLTSENLSESQPIPSVDLGPLESSTEDTIADLGDHGTSLCQCLEELAHGLAWLTL